MAGFRRLCVNCLTEKAPSPRVYVLLTFIALGLMIYFKSFIHQNFFTTLRDPSTLPSLVTDSVQPRPFRCFSPDSKGNVLQLLNESQVPIGSSFFFIETSCPIDDSNKEIHLNARQACTVESTALHHPNNSVYFLMVAPVLTDIYSTNNKAVKGLLQYSNIKIRHINLFDFLANTPVSPVLDKRDGLRTSQHPVAHTSDTLRYTTLLKFRGTYMDLDIIVIKPLLNRTNFVGAESVRSLGAGIFNFGSNDVGDSMANECALELTRSFNGTHWGTSGPGVITRVLERKCHTNKIPEMFDKDCEGFHVYPVPVFYSFPFWESSFFFEPNQLAKAQKLVNSSLGIHYWNKITAEYKLSKDKPDVPFLHYARNNCPKVYEAVDGDF